MLDTGNMTPFSVYRERDGVVVNNGFASSLSSLAAQAGEGELVYIGEALEKGSIVQADGQIVRALQAIARITVADIKAEQARRLRYTDWAVTRAADPTDGRPIPEGIVQQRTAIREAAQRLERLREIPPDYRDEKYWN